MAIIPSKITKRSAKVMFLSVYLALLAGFFQTYLQFRVTGYSINDESLRVAFYSKAQDYLICTNLSLAATVFLISSVLIDFFAQNYSMLGSALLWLCVFSIMLTFLFFGMISICQNKEDTIIDDLFVSKQYPFVYIFSYGLVITSLCFFIVSFYMAYAKVRIK